MKKIISIADRTRTNDKYRVVYSDHQRLELEKEFHYSRYLTPTRKSKLAQGLNLSERQVSSTYILRGFSFCDYMCPGTNIEMANTIWQVKIWFQNRRAKERKYLKKQEQLLQDRKMEVARLHAQASQVRSAFQVPSMFHPHTLL